MFCNRNYVINIKIISCHKDITMIAIFSSIFLMRREESKHFNDKDNAADAYIVESTNVHLLGF
jgi:hypothetical protein